MTITRLDINTITLDITKEDWESGFRSRLQKRRLETYDACLDCAVARAAQKNGYGEVRVGGASDAGLMTVGGCLYVEPDTGPIALTHPSRALAKLYQMFDDAAKLAELPPPTQLKLRLRKAGRDYFRPTVQQ